jgi:hypothetical protein
MNLTSDSEILADEVGGDTDVGRGSAGSTSSSVGSAAVASSIAVISRACSSIRNSWNGSRSGSGSGAVGSITLEESLVKELSGDGNEAEGSNNDGLEHGLFDC